MNGNIICLFHINTNKPALYSHTTLFDDRSQEVSCCKDKSEKTIRYKYSTWNTIMCCIEIFFGYINDLVMFFFQWRAELID